MVELAYLFGKKTGQSGVAETDLAFRSEFRFEQLKPENRPETKKRLVQREILPIDEEQTENEEEREERTEIVEKQSEEELETITTKFGEIQRTNQQLKLRKEMQKLKES
jgi:hypothetical protein